MKVNITFCSKDLYDKTKNSFNTQGILLNEGQLILKFSDPYGVINIIEYDNEKITITRKNISKMFFIKNKETKSLISTPVGKLNIHIYTKELTVQHNSITIKYMIENDETQNKELKILFKESAK